MMSLASQMYDYYVKPYLGEKGQDLVEYALLLAIVVGIGFLIYQQSGLNDHLTTIFSNAGDLTSSAADVSTLLLLLLMLRLDIKEGLKNPCYGRSSLERRSIIDWPFFQRT